MDHLNVMFGIMNIFIGSLIMLVCVPLARGRVKMNEYYGMRFRQAHESEEAWYAINRYGGTQMIIWSAALVGLGVLFLFVPVRPGTTVFWIAAIAPLLLLVPGFLSYRFARRFSNEDRNAG